MTDFEQALQECLRDVEEGAWSVDECLARYPKYARELEPILLTGDYLARGGHARVSEAFKARVRTRLIQHMDAHPRKPARQAFPFLHLATGLAVLLVALLVAGTVYAQGALPGEAFYAWKLASESAWRAVSPDPIATDLAIAQRRVDELLAVQHDAALSAEVLNAYIEVSDRLRSQMDAETEALILQALETQIRELNQSGILPVKSGPDQEILPPLDELTPAPTAASPSILPRPRFDPTSLPPVAPTTQSPLQPPVEIPPGDASPGQDPVQTLPAVVVPTLIP